MDLEFVPTLGTLVELYSMPRDMKRFRAYIGEMTGGSGDIVLPIVVANPMAKEHMLPIVESYVAAGAEEAARGAVEVARRSLAGVSGAFKVAIVVADDVAGGWTDRDLTDAQARFESSAMVKRGFATAILWSSESPSVEVVRERVLAAIYRAAYVRRHGEAVTLADRLRQEGLALRFAGARGPVLSAADAARARGVVGARLSARDNPTLFAAMYGDEAARRVGHAPLGLPAYAGFAVALTEALVERAAPESYLA